MFNIIHSGILDHVTAQYDSGSIGNKRQREQLRNTMRNQGHTTEQIALEMVRQWRFRPRQAWRHAHGLTQEEVATRYNQLLDGGQAPMSGKRISDYETWPAAGVKPSIAALSVLATVYGASVSQLVDQQDRDALSPHERVAVEPQAGLLRIDRPATVPTPRQSARELFNVVSTESARHAEEKQANVLAEATLESITADVERLAREHMYIEPSFILTDIIQTRDRINRLLARRQYPQQTTQLYYLASIIALVLADIAMGYGFTQSALQQIRAGSTYAEIIGHDSLRMWNRLWQSLVSRDYNRPEYALDIAKSAIPFATEPIAKASLYGSIALLSAWTVGPDEARAALAIAADANEKAARNSELSDEIGGIFARPHARFLQLSTRTHFALGDFPRAERDAKEAVQFYADTDLPEKFRAVGSQSSVQISLGQARLLRDDIEGATEALRPVLDLPPWRRFDWLSGLLNEFQTSLQSHRSSTSQQGQQLSQEITEFFRTTAVDSYTKSG